MNDIISDGLEKELGYIKTKQLGINKSTEIYFCNRDNYNFSIYNVNNLCPLPPKNQEYDI